MKRLRLLFLALCACALCACAGESRRSGRVVEANTEAGEGLVSFVVRTEEGDLHAFLMEEDSHVFSFIEGIDYADFKAGALQDIIVSVDSAGPRRPFSTREGTETGARRAAQVEIRAYRDAEALCLPDGTQVDIWKHSGASYYVLPNGIELLREQDPVGPANSYTGGVESLDALDKAAQAEVLAFYRARGLLYELRAELERAYAAYRAAEDASAFTGRMLGQDISPSASSDTVLYFLTSVLLPAGGAQGYERRCGEAFDKTTGAYIDNRSLFSCPPEELAGRLLDIAQIEEPLLRAQMERAFDSANLVFFPEGLEICFPQGTLPSREHTTLLSLGYEGALLDILYGWAVPVQR